MDAGLRLQDKLPEPEPVEPDKPDRGHHSSGGGSGKVTGHAVKQPEPVIEPFPEEQPATPSNAEEPPFFGIPKTGVVPIGITALTIAVIAGAIMFMTRFDDDEEKKGKKGKKSKNKKHEN